MHYIGIDMGSTCTKLVVMDADKSILYKKVAPTGWSCVSAADGFLQELAQMDITLDNSRCVATGYGRVSVPYANKTVTEISCHGRGACHIFDEKDMTVIDIGGQDTKIIELEGGAVKDFIMNDKCSAGTGRFLEIMAGTLGVDLNALCELARGSENHVSISSMCTVFAESEVVSLIGSGASKADIAYGIVESIVNKVYGQMGKTQKGAGGVHLTGGLCEVPFIMEMLSQKLGVSVTSAPLARYAGAVGAALYAAAIE